MLPKKNQYVKLFFHNGLTLEGFVHEWTDESAAIFSPKKNLIIIQNPKKELLVIEILLLNDAAEKDNKEVIEQNTNKTEYRTNDPILDTKSLADLHILKMQEEKKAIRAKMTSFKNQGIQAIDYGLPRRIQKPPHFNPRKKD